MGKLPGQFGISHPVAWSREREIFSLAARQFAMNMRTLKNELRPAHNWFASSALQRAAQSVQA